MLVSRCVWIRLWVVLPRGAMFTISILHLVVFWFLSLPSSCTIVQMVGFARSSSDRHPLHGVNSPRPRITMHRHSPPRGYYHATSHPDWLSLALALGQSIFS
jgi:hypothetical protein